MLSIMYDKGHSVEKNEKKELRHLEEAAIGGHPNARNNLGCIEFSNDRHERAMKHFVMAATLGYDMSLAKVKVCFKIGHVSKENFAAALRAHQAAVDATKSPQREEADAFQRYKKNWD